MNDGSENSLADYSKYPDFSVMGHQFSTQECGRSKKMVGGTNQSRICPLNSYSENRQKMLLWL